MTRLVVDTNIVFSAMLNINSRIGQILLNGYKYYKFLSPNYIRTELIEHKDRIIQIAGLTDDRFVELFELILRNITIINHSVVPHKYYKIGMNLCSDIDEEDIAFVAVNEYLNAKLWTGDKSLMKGLTKKGYTSFITTDELYQEFLYKEKIRKK